MNKGSWNSKGLRHKTLTLLGSDYHITLVQKKSESELEPQSSWVTSEGQNENLHRRREPRLFKNKQTHQTNQPKPNNNKKTYANKAISSSGEFSQSSGLGPNYQEKAHGCKVKTLLDTHCPRTLRGSVLSHFHLFFHTHVKKLHNCLDNPLVLTVP